MHPTKPTIEYFNSSKQILVEKAQNRLAQVLSILGSIELMQNMTQTRDKNNKEDSALEKGGGYSGKWPRPPKMYGSLLIRK